MKTKIILMLFLGSSIVNNLAHAEGHHHKHHDKFSISLNFGNDQSPPPPAPVYVMNTPHHHHHHHQQYPYYQWVDMSQGYPLPMNAVQGGFQPHPRSSLFVCRASYMNGMHPGKVFKGLCNISWGGREIPIRDYQVLVSNGPLSWQPGQYGSLPANAIQGGDYDGGPLYICQTVYGGGTHPGKLVNGTCNIGWGGREVASSYYNVLVG
jgi:DM9 repeat